MRFRLHVRYRLCWATSWHVGSGFGSASIDRLVRRRRIGQAEVPYVPGSQIKGLLRHTCEQLVATMQGEVVDVHGADRESRETLARNFLPLESSRLLVDRLFGSRYDGECLFCGHAQPDSPGRRTLPVVSRNSIDRATGTAAAQKLFSTEIVPDNWWTLVGEIEGSHRAAQLTTSETDFPYEYSFLIAALRLLDAIGGDRNAGRGRVRVALESLRWSSPKNPSWRDISEADSLAPLGEDDQLPELIQMTRDEA